MKLRNKKTGAVANYSIILQRETGNGSNKAPIRYGCGTLAKLNKDWEDYKPAEPLIKDEKIRKAVRAWADADGADEKIYLTIDENGSRFANKYGGYIEFAFQIDMDERLYTIVELCGEEEE